MKQPGIFFVFFLFIAGVTFALAQQQRLGNQSLTAKLSTDPVGGPTWNAKGTIRITPNLAKSQLCYKLESDLPTPSAITISSYYYKDTIDPFAVILKSQHAYSTDNCVSVEHDRILDILRNPTNYYVLVMSSEFSSKELGGRLEY